MTTNTFNPLTTTQQHQHNILTYNDNLSAIGRNIPTRTGGVTSQTARPTSIVAAARFAAIHITGVWFHCFTVWILNGFDVPIGSLVVTVLLLFTTYTPKTSYCYPSAWSCGSPFAAYSGPMRPRDSAASTDGTDSFTVAAIRKALQGICRPGVLALAPSCIVLLRRQDLCGRMANVSR